MYASGLHYLSKYSVTERKNVRTFWSTRTQHTILYRRCTEQFKLHFTDIHVVVNFLSQVIFVFLLFLGMVIYANEVETKEK